MNCVLQELGKTNGHLMRTAALTKFWDSGQAAFLRLRKKHNPAKPEERRSIGSDRVGYWLSGKGKIPGPVEAAISLVLEVGSQPRVTMTPAELQVENEIGVKNGTYFATGNVNKELEINKVLSERIIVRSFIGRSWFQ